MVKVKIFSNDVLKIKCPECNVIWDDNVIKQILIDDDKLFNKYKAFKERKQLLLNPNYRECIRTNCDGIII